MLVIKAIYKSYFDYIGYKYEPRCDHLPLMGSPFKILALLIGYLYFVKIKGPQFMKNRQPYNLYKIMLVYNTLQVLLNFWLGFYVLGRIIFAYDIDFSCLTSDFTNSERGMDEVMVTYIYFLLKVLDLLDTIFFVLRKKYNQITFLHVYHHTIMCVAVYIATRYLPAGHGGIMGLVNTFVHVIMYSYYLVSTLNPNFKKSLWWKKYVTQVQMFQFSILIIHFLRPIYNGNCDYPFFVIIGCLIQNIFMLTLFGDFYLKTYIRNTPKTKNQ